MPATEATVSVVSVTAMSVNSLPVTAPISAVPMALTATAGPGVRLTVSTLLACWWIRVPEPVSQTSWSVIERLTT